MSAMSRTKNLSLQIRTFDLSLYDLEKLTVNAMK